LPIILMFQIHAEHEVNSILTNNVLACQNILSQPKEIDVKYLDLFIIGPGTDTLFSMFCRTPDETLLLNGSSPPLPPLRFPGDANCDEIANVLDVVTTGNYILGAYPQPFCFNRADVNRDGIVNLLDLVGIVNIILGKK
jgi:hypothetical protein